MLLGLGTGSTVQHFLEALAARVRAGLGIRGVPTSLRTESEATRLGIPLTTLDEAPELDLCIDGADEVDPRLDCLKGLGGALVREKVVAAAARRFILIVDGSKMVPRLGTGAPVLVEVIPFAVSAVAHRLDDLSPRRRERDGAPFLSDNGNQVLELTTGPLADPAALASRLNALPGVLDHGLFLDMAHAAYVATSEGVRRYDRSSS
jgi:ribose 5-phosphate isomerase A